MLPAFSVFFIERNEELALRLEGEFISAFGTAHDKVEANGYHNTFLFQYMIGNYSLYVSQSPTHSNLQKFIKFSQTIV